MSEDKNQSSTTRSPWSYFSSRSARRIGAASIITAVCLVAFNNCSGFITAINPNALQSHNFASLFKSDNRKIWINPNSTQGLAADWNKIFQNPDQWSYLLSRMQVYQTFQANLANLPSTEIRAMVDVLSKNKIYFGIESYGLLPYACFNNHPGAYSAQQFLKDTKPFYDAGGRVSFVSLDGTGIWFALANNNRPDNNCNLSLDTAYQEIAIFMQQIHAVHPEVQFGLLTGLPGLNYNGTRCYFATCDGWEGKDYRDVLNGIVQVARANGEDYKFVHVDNPYDYMINHPGISNVVTQRMIPLQQQVSGLGMRFGLIHNSDLSIGGANSDSYTQAVNYTTNTMHSLELLSAGGGLVENDFIVESWFAFPSIILPETTQFNFAYLGNLMIDTYQGMLDQQGLSRPVANPGNGNYGALIASDSTDAASPASATLASTAPISYGAIASGAAITCDQLNPDAIKSLSTDTIAWLGSLQTSGLTLHENYLIARQSGYNGAFGHGEHNAWLAQDPSRLSTFNAAVTAFANQPVAPSWSTRIAHNQDRKNAGYKGVFECGGDSCFQAGGCDEYGRRN